MLIKTPVRKIIALVLVMMSLALLALTPWFTLTDAAVAILAVSLAWALTVMFFLSFYHRYWMVMMVGRVTGRKAVELLGCDGKRYYSLAQPQEDGSMIASVYWFTNVGRCTLEPSGLIDRNSQSGYIYFWLPLEKKQRVMHVLMNDLPDFNLLDNQSSAEKRNIMRGFIERYQS